MMFYREYVLLHRDNNTSTTFQDAAYQNRVSLKDGLQGGDVSLLLRNVKYSDSGSYECQVFYKGVEGNEQKTVCVNNLTVKTSGECFCIRDDVMSSAAAGQ